MNAASGCIRISSLSHPSAYKIFAVHLSCTFDSSPTRFSRPRVPSPRRLPKLPAIHPSQATTSSPVPAPSHISPSSQRSIHLPRTHIPLHSTPALSAHTAHPTPHPGTQPSRHPTILPSLTPPSHPPQWATAAANPPPPPQPLATTTSPRQGACSALCPLHNLKPPCLRAGH